FGPMDAGLDLLHAPGQRVLTLIEPVDVAPGARELPLVLAELHVAPHRHPVADVLGQQAEPFLVAPLVEQLRLAIEEIGDLLANQQPIDACIALSHRAPPHRAVQPRPCAPTRARRPESLLVPNPPPGPVCIARWPRGRARPARRRRGPVRRRARYPSR